MLPREVRLAVWVTMGFTAILAVSLNLFIVLMSLRSYRRNGHWAPCETIVAALSLANGAYQLASYSWVTLQEADGKCYLDGDAFSLLLLTVFSLKFTIIWTTAFLTFFYSTKLVIEPIHCYTKIQEAFLKHAGTVVALIPICGLGSCVPLLPVFNVANSTVPRGYCGAIAVGGHSGAIYLGCYLLISDIAPGLLILKSSISITVHLAIHLRHMKASNNGFHNPKLSSEMRVVHMNLTLVVVFLCFLFMDLFTNYVTVVHGENLMEITMFFTSLYIAISSLVLIYGKKSFWKGLLHQFNLFLDEFPCLRCLKLPETKTGTVGPGPGH